MNWIEKQIGEFVIRKKWWILFIAIIIGLITTAGTQFLSFNNDTRVFFSEKNPQLQALEELENTYNKISSVFFAIAPRDGDVFTKVTLAAVEQLTENSWQIPHSTRVNSITNFQYTFVEDDDLLVENLVQNANSMSKTDVDRIRKMALSEPQLVNTLLSPSGHATGISVDIILPGKSIKETPEVAAYVRDMADQFREENTQIDIYLTGTILSDTAFGEISQRDMSTLTPLMFLMLLIIAGFALRSFTGFFSTLIIIVTSMLTGMGLAGWTGISLTSASAVAPTIILTLALADSIHILTTMFQQMRQGKSKSKAIVESLRINFKPVFITSVTTAIGFLSMNFSDAPPFRDLGNIVAMGVIAAFMYSIFFLPSLMAVLPIRLKTRNYVRHSFLNNLSNVLINKRKVVFWGMSIAIVLLITGISSIEFNDQFIKYFSEEIDIRRAADFVEINLRGGDEIQYSLKSGETGGISDPEYLKTIEEFAEWYRNQSKVVHVATITDIMKRLNRDMNGGDEFYYRIPESRELAAQYLLVYEMSLPFGHDLNNQINVDKSATRMIVSLKDVNTNELKEMDKKARHWLRVNASEKMNTYGSGLSIIWAHISERNINSMLGAALGALLLISAILIFALRSFKLGLLSLIPNLAPAFMAFGIWGLIVGRVGLGLSIIASMTLGIVVDDTVHFMSKYLRARRENHMNPQNAVRYSFKTVGTALWVTSFALVAGFMILTFSDYKMTSDMGLMSAITITLALVLDFIYLPVLLIKLEEKTEITTNTKKENSDERIIFKKYQKAADDHIVLPDVVAVPLSSKHKGRDA
jgi:predicted RND superfamily exporter protein